MVRAALLVLTIATLLLAPLECAAACAGQECVSSGSGHSSVPPCHRHRSHSHEPLSGHCIYQAMVPPAGSTVALRWEAARYPVIGRSLSVPPTAALRHGYAELMLLSLAPPGREELASVILRI